MELAFITNVPCDSLNKVTVNGALSNFKLVRRFLDVKWVEKSPQCKAGTDHTHTQYRAIHSIPKRNTWAEPAPGLLPAIGLCIYTVRLSLFRDTMKPKLQGTFCSLPFIREWNDAVWNMVLFCFSGVS